MENYIQGLFADRIGGKAFGKDTVLYKFEKIKRAKAAAKLAHPDVPLIDMGVGEPDDRADDGIVDVLAVEARKRENRYYADNGIPEFKRAAATYLQQVFGVTGIDPEREINHAIGSKPALAMLPSVFINPGDVSIMPVPNYPVLGTHTNWSGGEVYHLPLTRANHFLPDLASVPDAIARRTKLLYLNYPNNPTGATATREFFQEVIDFAKHYEILVVHDAAYAALTFDGTAPLSFLSVPGAKEVGIEMFSFSKAFNMTGWRLAFVAGNELAVKGFATVKDNNDSGQFMAIQKAAIYGLEHPEITRHIAEKYSRRHGLLVEALQALGFAAEKPKGSFFLYTPAPKGIVGGLRFANAEEFSQYLITEKQISTVPWDDAGAFVRWSVTFEADGVEAERAVIAQISHRLQDVKFEF
jgi:LL-diaminopimelate aminotransferase